MKVASLWRYPVKSMLGESRERLALDRRGVEGDRLYAVHDRYGKFGSGKSSSRFRRMDGLFGFHAAYEDGVPVLRFPDGRVVRGDDARMHSLLSEVIGMPVKLAKESGTPHHDAAGLHILTSASLAWLRRALPEAKIDERRFRPNLVLEVDGDGPVEQGWLGRTLAIGPQVVLRVSEPTERCVMTTLAQDDLPKDTRVLDGIVRQAGACFGVYAEVVAPGALRRGDTVTLRG